MTVCTVRTRPPQATRGYDETNRPEKEAGAGHELAVWPVLYRSGLEDLAGRVSRGELAVILEAMASCVPVLATDIPGNQEILEDGKSGWLVPPGNPGAMAETILWALRRPSLRRRYARQARDAVEAFSIETVSRQYERLYLYLQREAYGRQNSKD